MADPAVIHDGRIKPSPEAAVPVTSRGLMYGEGCFETLRSYSGRFLFLNEHLKRLSAGLDFLGMHYPEGLKNQALLSQIKKLLRENGLTKKEAVVRLQVWREGERGYKVKEPGRPHFSITATPVRQKEKPYRLATVAVKRTPSKAVPAEYKLSNGINNILAAQQVRRQKADDGLMLTTDNHISETTTANVFWLNKNTAYTPSADCDILPGVTRDVVIDILRNTMNIEVKEGAFGMEAIKQAESVWICNSLKEIAAVSRIDESKFQTSTTFMQELDETFATFRNKHLS